jgi:hypothetical protein
VRVILWCSLYLGVKLLDEIVWTAIFFLAMCCTKFHSFCVCVGGNKNKINPTENCAFGWT